MTTYYAKPFEAIDKNVYGVNPAAYLGAYANFGNFPIKVADPWGTRYVHYNAVRSASNAHMGDEPRYADAESILDPGFTKFKFFSWSQTVDWVGYQSLVDNPDGIYAKQLADEMQNQQDYFAKQLDDFLINYVTVNTGSRDEDPEWLGMLHGKAATGTVKDPVDICSTPGTVEDLKAINLSGTAQTVGAIDKTIGTIRRRFFQQYDSTTTRAMYRKSNTFDLWWHPAVTEQLRGTHESNASGELDYSQDTLANIKNDLSGGKIIETYATDAAYDGATTTVADACILTMNTKENFQVAEMIPYTILPWERIPPVGDHGPVFRKLAYIKIGCFIKPYYISSTWRKAACPFKMTPYENT